MIAIASVGISRMVFSEGTLEGRVAQGQVYLQLQYQNTENTKKLYEPIFLEIYITYLLGSNLFFWNSHLLIDIYIRPQGATPRNWSAIFNVSTVRNPFNLLSSSPQHCQRNSHRIPR